MTVLLKDYLMNAKFLGIGSMDTTLNNINILYSSLLLVGV